MGCGSAIRAAPRNEPLSITPMLRAPSMDSTRSAASSGQAPPGPAAVLVHTLQHDADVYTDADCELSLFGSSLCLDGSAGCEAVVEPEFNEKHFEAKCTNCEGLAALREKLQGEGVAFACKKGRKPKSPNQDNLFLLQATGLTILGVADGHGLHGHWASHWAVRYVLWQLLNEVTPRGTLPDPTAMNRVFNIAHEALELRAEQDGFDLSASGTTLTMCFVDQTTRQLLAAWVGDSRCIVGNCGAAASALTSDHKPSVLEERRRIFSKGGTIRADSGCPRVSDGRTEGDFGLALTRALGDVVLHKFGVIHVPATKNVPIEAKTAEGADESDKSPDGGSFVVCCSDGVWDMLSNEEVADDLGQAGREGVGAAVEALVAKARSRWHADVGPDGDVDDISAIVVWL